MTEGKITLLGFERIWSMMDHGSRIKIRLENGRQYKKGYSG